LDEWFLRDSCSLCRADGVKVVRQNTSSVAYDDIRLEGLATSEAFVPELNVIHGKLFNGDKIKPELESIRITGDLHISF
jgi:hypothetical protein